MALSEAEVQAIAGLDRWLRLGGTPSRADVLIVIEALRQRAASDVGKLRAALKQVAEGEFDDVDPDDGLHKNSVRAFARRQITGGGSP